MAQAKLTEAEFQKVKDLIGGKEPFSLDTNILASLAYMGSEGEKILKSLVTISFRTFTIPNSVIRELQGLIIHRIFDRIPTSYLSSFLTAYLRKKEQFKKTEEVKSVPEDSDKIRAFLEPMTEILPKKLVTDAVVQFYAEISKDIKNDLFVQKKANELTVNIVKKFDNLLKKYGIADIITPAEKSEYFRIAESIKKELVIFIIRNRNNPKAIEQFLGVEKSKSYEKDVKIVSAAVSHHEKIASKDSDVNWLGRFYEISQRRAA